MNRNERVVVADAGSVGVRLDKYLSEREDLFPRSQYGKRQVQVLLRGKLLKPSYKLEGGESFEVSWDPAAEVSFEPENIPLDILYEDELTLVVNKPRGMVVHPAHGNWSGTLVHALLFHVKELDEQFEESDARPGIVHRLDKDTTGVLITAKSTAALEVLSAQFRERTTQKVYYAVLKGQPSVGEGVLETYLGRDQVHRQRFAVTTAEHGKFSVTGWKILATVPGYALVEFRPHTGRTHQLRVHALHLKCPILGDPIYARPDARMPHASLMLHASRLRIQLPGHVEPQEFTAPLPPDFQTVLQSLGLPDPLTCAPG